MIRAAIWSGVFIVVGGLAPGALGDDGAVDLSMNCFNEAKQEWRRYEKIGDSIRAVKDDVAGDPEPIKEFDDANGRYVVQLKTYSGAVNIEYDFNKLTVKKELVSGPQTMSCE